jgi:hypothetical protein
MVRGRAIRGDTVRETPVPGVPPEPELPGPAPEAGPLAGISRVPAPLVLAAPAPGMLAPAAAELPGPAPETAPETGPLPGSSFEWARLWGLEGMEGLDSIDRGEILGAESTGLDSMLSLEIFCFCKFLSLTKLRK